MKPIVAGVVLLSALTATVADAAPRDLAAQVSGTGLSFLAGEIPALLPTSFSHAGFNQQLLDCPFTSSETSLKVTDVQASVKVSSLELVPESTGRLRIKITASASGHLYGAANPCYLSDVKCRFDFSLSSSQASASFIPGVVSGKLKLGSPQIDLALQENNVSVQAASCGMVGSVINLVLPHVKGWLLGKLESWLEGLLLQSVPPEVEKALADFAQVSGTAAGLSASGQLEAASVAGGGVSLGLQVSVKPAKNASCTLPKAGTISSVTSTPSFSFQGEHLGMALSASTLSEALSAAWSAGYFCLTDAQLAGLGLPSTMKPIAGLAFGLSSTDSIAVHVHQQPKLSLTPGSGAAAQISIPALAIELKGKGPSGSATVTATVPATASVKLVLDPITRAIAVDSVKTTLGTAKLSSTDAAISPSPAVIEKLLTDLVLPLVEKQLGGLELLPQVVRQSGGILDPYFLYLARGVAVADYASLYVRVYKQPASDSSTPSTLLENKPAALAAPQLFRFVASGSDLETPSPLLRFSWRVDSGSWSTPSYSRARTVALADGKHSVEVRTVDLSGKSDPSPASASFVIDGIRPTLSVTAPPAGLQPGSTAQVSFVASDDRTPASELEVSLKLEQRASSNAAFSTVREDPFAKTTGSFSLAALQAGEYRLTLSARDSVGNLSDPEIASFSVGAGASSPAPGASGPPEAPGAWGTPVEKSPNADAGTRTFEGGCSLAPRIEAGELASALLLVLGGLLLLAFARHARTRLIPDQRRRG